MKKIVSLLLVVTTCLSTVAALSACSFKHPIEKMKEKLEKEGSYKVTIKLSALFEDSISGSVEVDGDLCYMPKTDLNSGECYTQAVDSEKEIKILKSHSGWEKTNFAVWKKPIWRVVTNETLEDLLDADRYSESGAENTYEQKRTAAFDGIEDVVIFLDDDSFAIEATVTSGNYKGYDVKIVFSKIGDVEVTLPENIQES